ncbi:MAG: hypothetical protein FWC70_00080 [Defluviitaleaceae bacterium]|nr:hypothetical protein [Defluviitaleaceae bacterium]
MTEYKFAFVACCFIIALLSRARCVSVKDWGLLSCGLFFTLWADYFLVLHNRHLEGVAVFCFVHVFYIIRARQACCEYRGQEPIATHALGAGTAERSFLSGNKLLAAFFCVAAIVWVIAFAAESVVVLAGLYATLFAVNLYVNIKARRRIITTGLVLFALCDISVGLYNLSHYVGLPQYFSGVFMLIWIFYLPAIGLLSVSAISGTPKIYSQENLSAR